MEMELMALGTGSDNRSNIAPGSGIGFRDSNLTTGGWTSSVASVIMLEYIVSLVTLLPGRVPENRKRKTKDRSNLIETIGWSLYQISLVEIGRSGIWGHILLDIVDGTCCVSGLDSFDKNDLPPSYTNFVSTDFKGADVRGLVLSNREFYMPETISLSSATSDEMLGWKSLY
ncbi:hypothetical protein Tco_1093755 [Tanacetum coccineum]|uniref:Uncharacterized protein n=1 Tax=Tanacetum coccineum TaxID=301880 RepID=A0ABQ5IDL6_9ASTR